MFDDGILPPKIVNYKQMIAISGFKIVIIKLWIAIISFKIAIIKLRIVINGL